MQTIKKKDYSTVYKPRENNMIIITFKKLFCLIYWILMQFYEAMTGLET